MTFRVVCFGDIVGRAGRAALRKELKRLRTEHAIDCVIANGENAAGGVGFDSECASELLGLGINIITLGDHTWSKKDSKELLARRANTCIRPANYPDGTPGAGSTIWLSPSGLKVGVMNLMGRVFMTPTLGCPFRKADELLSGPLKDCEVIICDLHAEATSEKIAMGRYLDGRVTVLFGTHTHVQTADERILPGGTAYITDLGMCGPLDSVIGMDAEVALSRFLTAMPASYKPGRGDACLNGIIVEIETGTPSRALSIKRLSEEVKV